MSMNEDKKKYAKIAVKLLDRKIPTFEEISDMYDHECIQMLWCMLCIHEWSPDILSGYDTIKAWPLPGIPVERLEKFVESLDMDILDPPYFLCCNLKHREITKVLAKIEKEKLKVTKQAKVVGTGQFYGYYSVTKNDEDDYVVINYSHPPKNIEFFEIRCIYCELVLSSYMNNYIGTAKMIPPDRRPKIPDYARVIYELLD